MVKAFYDFQTTKLADYTSKLKAGDWCLGDKAYTRSGSSGSYTYTALNEYDYSSSMYYDSYVRLYGNTEKTPTYKCNGTILNEFDDVSGVSSKAPMYVSAITADEIVYAGGKVYSSNEKYYLINDYQYDNGEWFWSLSPGDFDGGDDYAFNVYNYGYLSDYDVYDSGAFCPAVSLKSSTIIVQGGEGTKTNPYVIG